jgi:SP family myo-inositol transporter-like MFS transporter 13
MTEEEVSIGVLNVAAAFGGLLAGQLADRFGRRLSLALANLLFFIGSLMLAVCQGFDVLALGRVIMGLGVGVGELSLSPSLSFSLSLYVA